MAAVPVAGKAVAAPGGGGGGRPAVAAGEDTPGPKGEGERTEVKDRIEPGERARMLGKGYAKSDDIAWATTSDADGYHVMVARERDGYAWKTAASLSEDGFDTDMWIGNACAADTENLVVTYAPRTFTNKANLMARGAFAATVSLTTGEVTKLGHQASLAYFSPGCGTDGTAVLSQFTDEITRDRNETRLVPVDVKSGKTGKPVKLTGQVTSAVPVDDGWVATDGPRLIHIDKQGERRAIALTNGAPFSLTPDERGGITFLDHVPAKGLQASQGTARAQVRRVTAAQISRDEAVKPAVLAEGALDEIELTRSARGRVLITGTPEARGPLPGSVHMAPKGVRKDARVSTHDRTTVSATWADDADPRVRPADPASARPAEFTMRMLGTGEKTVLETLPGTELVGRADGAAAPSPALPSTSLDVRAAASSPSEDEATRTCAVERNNPRSQAIQPQPRQVEWAVNMAVAGKLDQYATRPANWNNTGLSAYSPQSLAGGRPTVRIPSAIMLGVTAQESNMWQASKFAAPGISANPLIGNYYGIHYDPHGTPEDGYWSPDWKASDCGYGITQITDGMRLAGKPYEDGSTQTPKSALYQQAIALDYAANIAAGVTVLAEKWEQVDGNGMQVNNGDPARIENWTMALWAYNSGFHLKGDDASGQWGLGWTNNPAMPWYKPNRNPFLEGVNCTGGTCTFYDDYSHAASPQYWPYQEKVIGWAARPLAAMTDPGTYVPGYRPAWWSGDSVTGPLNRHQAKPPESLFCDTSNECEPERIGSTDPDNPAPAASPCRRGDFKCWWTSDVTWKADCESTCGHSVERFTDPDVTKEQPWLNPHLPDCTGPPVEGAYVVDNVNNGQNLTSNGIRCADGTAHSDGSFAFDFAEGEDPARIDTHQLSAGYGNHMWFSHTVKSPAAATAVTGTWTAPEAVKGWTRVLVHMPKIASRSQQAEYQVAGSDSTSPNRVQPQRTWKNEWKSIGTFNFTGRAQVKLSNVTEETSVSGYENVNLPISWDAVAFQPLGAKPTHVVGMGDSYASGEGAIGNKVEYFGETDHAEDFDGHDVRNTCHRSKNAWVRQARLPGRTESIGAVSDTYGNIDLSFIACSGARTYNLVHGGINQTKTSLPQMDLGYLDQNTSLVALSIGGNDAGFSRVIEECLKDFECLASQSLPVLDPDTGKETGETIGGPMSIYIENWIKDEVFSHVREVLEQIKVRAPNARVILMGYPSLISSSDTGCLAAGDTHLYVGLSDAEQNWMDNTVAPLLAEYMGRAAQETGAEFVNPEREFEGHRICDDGHALWGIGTTSIAEADGDQPMHWFHPDATGAGLFTRALERGLGR